MNKTFIFGLMAAALGFTACSSEDDAIIADKPQKGMVLKASVNQPSETRAEITQNSATDWTFAFAANDEVKVTNSEYTGYYTFTSDGTNFKSSDATAVAATWYAYFPSETIDLSGQTGQLSGIGKSVANLYALAGTATTASAEAALSVTMNPKVAILKITSEKANINIQVKNADGKYVTGLTAKSGQAGFDLVTSTTSTSLFTATAVGTYYVVVPAGVYISVLDDGEVENSTKVAGFTAGKYYELQIENAVRPTFVSYNGSKSADDGEGPGKLLDASGVTTKWCEAKSDAKWDMVVSLTTSSKLNAIKLWNSNDTESYPKRIWKSLTISGSDSADGTWTEIYTNTDLGLSINNFGLAGELMVSAGTAYQYYKLEIGVDPYSPDNTWEAANTMQMADMKFVLE